MRWTLLALAAALAASASPAAACGFFECAPPALGDDAYPPAAPSLPPAVQVEVDARGGKGLSLAGFYNDPSLALAAPAYAPPPPSYGYAPQPAFIEAPPVYVAPPRVYGGYGYGYRARPRGPRVIMSPYGHHAAHPGAHPHVY